MDLDDIHKQILNCKSCDLYKTRTHCVPGEGNYKSGIMFIGEAPGKEEDKQGRPFVGAAGKYLTEVLEKNGIKRQDVYITNVLKCRPPNNRDPKPEEVETCSKWLRMQLDFIKPSIIVTLGRFSTQWIFEYFNLTYTSITKLRGKVYTVEKWNKTIYIIPTLHPAAVLYHPRWKPMFEHDISLINSVLKGETKPEKKSILDYFKK